MIQKKLTCMASLIGIFMSYGQTPWAAGIPAQFGIAPDNSKDMLIAAFNSAEKSLLINIYDFSGDDFTQAVIDQIKAGVTVKILIEGEPIPSMSAGAKQLLAKVHTAMKASKNKNHRIFIMSKPQDSKSRRFRFDHAKYAIIDNQSVFVSSNNFNETGHGEPGTATDRGWDVLLDDSDLANQLTQMFDSDSASGNDDLVTIKPSDKIPSKWQPGSEATALSPDEPKGPSLRSYRGSKPKPLPQGKGEVDSVDVVTSPNAMPGLQKFLRSAQKSLNVEQMSFPSVWRDDSNKQIQSEIVSEVIAAARRGADVQVLLNDETKYGMNAGEKNVATKKATPNEITVKLLLSLASCEHLNLDARIVDTEAVGIKIIHNKGYTADGERALVSSVNGTRNSVMQNRELGLSLESSDAAEYFDKAFDVDWSKSENPTFAQRISAVELPAEIAADMPGCASSYNSLLTQFLAPSIFR